MIGIERRDEENDENGEERREHTVKYRVEYCDLQPALARTSEKGAVFGVVEEFSERFPLAHGGLIDGVGCVERVRLYSSGHDDFVFGMARLNSRVM